LWFGRDGTEEEVRAALGVDKLPDINEDACIDECVVAEEYTSSTAAACAEGARRKGTRFVIASTSTSSAT